MHDPYPLRAHALCSNSNRARVRYLLHLMRAERLCEDRWRLPGGKLLSGTLEDFVRSVDCVKQIEQWAIERQGAELGYEELAIQVARPHFGIGWEAAIQPLVTNPYLCESGVKDSESIARIEALIGYFDLEARNRDSD